MVVKGRNRDTAWFSMLDGEWPAVTAGFEAWLDPANFDGDGVQRAATRRPAVSSGVPPTPRSRAAAVLVDQRRLGVGDRGVRGEVVDDELAQVLRVGRGEPHEVVRRARQVEDRQHAGQVAHGAGEGVDLLAVVDGQAHGDHRLQRAAQGGEVDLGVKAAQDARTRAAPGRAASAVDGATPTRSASLLFGIRAFSLSASRIARSVSSRRRSFGMAAS